MDIGNPIKIHNIPAPQEQPKRIPNYRPMRRAVPLPSPKIEPEPIPVPNWPVKVPEKVDV